MAAQIAGTRPCHGGLPPHRHARARRAVLLGLLAAVLPASGCATTDGPSRRSVVAATATPTATAPPVTGPTQPGTGPGGAQRRHAGARTTQVPSSIGQVSIVEPADPAPVSAPVVLFTQGVGPADYQGWIDHLVARGSIVVFQKQPYQAVDLTQRRKGPLAGLRAAMSELAKPGHVHPRWDWLVLVGHSVGGDMAGQLAADAAAQGLPRARALFALQPREEDSDSTAVLAGIPPTTMTIVLASDHDDRVGLEGPRAMWAALRSVPATRKEFVLVSSDRHGSPPLIADHLLSLSSDGNAPDALDYLGVWKLLDGLQDCATSGANCQYAFGGGPAETSMGSWSDGTPVTPLKVTAP